MAEKLSVELKAVPVTHNGQKVGTAYPLSKGKLELYLDDDELVKKIQGNMGDFSLGFTPREAKKKEG